MPGQSFTGLSCDGYKRSMKDTSRGKTGNGWKKGDNLAQEESDRTGREEQHKDFTSLTPPLQVCKNLSLSLARNLCHSPILF